LVLAKAAGVNKDDNCRDDQRRYDTIPTVHSQTSFDWRGNFTS
jgi:hypothetical protein